MPIEIRELVVRAVVRSESDEGDSAVSATVSAEMTEEIVEECVRQVLRILEKKKAR